MILTVARDRNGCLGDNNRSIIFRSDHMELVKVALTSVGSIIVLFVLTKLMGKRQMSQLSMFDYINSITIGSIAAEMATALEQDYRMPLLAMTIYAVVATSVSILDSKSITARRILTGKPIVIFNNGKIYKKNLKKSRLDLSEFLSECRISGYFDLSQLETAIFEPNGKLSFIPKSENRAVSPSDLSLNPSQQKMLGNVVIDGKIMQENLKCFGKDEVWLYKALKDMGVKNVSDIFLATCDTGNSLKVYYKIENDVPKDIFE